ncbi:hypothetical protein BH23ACT9_BH23ACT9_39490 [soil metagenome]
MLQLDTLPGAALVTRGLADQDVDAAHGRYNALVGQLVSFQRALACVA